MAATYSLIDSTWRARPLTRFLKVWAESARPQVIPPVTGEQSGGRLRAHFIGEGSLRGMSLTLRTRAFRTAAIDVTLPTMANGVDYALGFQLLRGLMENGGGTLTGPGGVDVNVQALTESEADAEGMRSLREGGGMVRQDLKDRGRAWAAMKFPRFDLFIVPGELPEELDDLEFARGLEARLIPRVRRYHVAADLDTMRTGDGIDILMWRMDDALADRLRYVAVMRDVAEGAFVLSWNEIIGLLGERIEIASTTGRRYFFPALRPGNAQDDALIERLLRTGIDIESFLAAHVVGM